MIEVWRGGVNAWECDEMGHMNVRFYVVRFMEGLAGLARALSLPHAFAPHAASTLIVREHHLRFLKEAHAGAPLSMLGGVVSHDEASARLLFVMLHADGTPAATVLAQVEHATPDGRVFPWPARAREALDALACQVPPHAAPRGVSDAPVVPSASLARADALGLACIGRGVVSPQACDAFGRMRPDEFIGRVSDGAPALLAEARRELASQVSGDGPRRVGGAVVEYRLLYLERAAAGDHLELRSGLVAIEGRTQRLVHWLLDPLSGRAWGVSEVVAVNLDLDARRAAPITDEARALLQRWVVPGLTL